jgi:hypothetical protein
VRTLALLAAAALALGAAGCMEVEQAAPGQKQGKYQGKPDTPPYANEPLAAGAGGAKWTKGDKASWENQIRTRNLAQNEYKRINQ